MSSRALRKIKGDDSLAHIRELLKKDESSSEEEGGGLASPVVNVFDLLGKDDDSSSHSEKESVPVPVATKSSKKKKKKKKNKSQPVKDKEEDIDAIISELNIEPNVANTAHQPTSNSCRQSALTVKRKNLSADNELRRIFGSQAVNNDQQRRRNHQVIKRRASAIATPKETWPPMTKCGIQMVVDYRSGDNTFYKFSHSKANYQNLQQLFWRASRQADPNAVKRVLEMHPYHIDTLLHLSEICRVSEDIQIASDLLERAIYCLECALHPNFNLASLNCRLDYNQSENRSLFIALFRHMKYVSLKSCWVTAFEISKLLFNLSPEQDPLACLLIMDILALKVEDYEFVLTIHDEFEHTKKLTYLPNFAFSFALANFYKELVLGERHDDSDGYLQEAILKFPMIAQMICSKCSYNIESNLLYVNNNDILKSHSKCLTQLCTLYIERALDMWKDPEVIPWLQRNIEYVNNNFSKHPSYNKAKKMRKEVFLSPPLNVMRHIFISDIAPVSAMLPVSAFENSQDPHDPMPPPGSKSEYYPEFQNRNENGNMILAFLNSLMPSYNPDTNPDAAIPGIEMGGLMQPAARGAEGGGGDGPMWGQVNGGFGQAIRNLVQNIQGLNNEEGEGEEMPEIIDEDREFEDDLD